MRMLDQAGAAERIDDAKLVVSELATNAVVHARSPFTVTVRVSQADVLIAVSDQSAQMPVRPDGSGHDDSGRGLALVTAVAEQWMVDQIPAGKRVWVQLRRTTGPDQANR